MMGLLRYFKPVSQKNRRKKYEHSPNYVPVWKKLPDAVGEDYRRGETLLEICARHHVSPTSLLRKLESLNVEIRPKGFPGTTKPKCSKLSPANVQWLLDQDSQDVPHAEIARRLGVTRERVRQICVLSGHRPRRARMTKMLALREAREAKKAERELMIQALSEQWKAGATADELAVIAGVTKTGVRNAIALLRAERPDLFPYRRPNHSKIKRAA